MIAKRLSIHLCPIGICRQFKRPDLEIQGDSGHVNVRCCDHLFANFPRPDLHRPICIR
jgi:hypothetical protein